MVIETLPHLGTLKRASRNGHPDIIKYSVVSNSRCQKYWHPVFKTSSQ